ncbi:MAG: thiamine-phosphate kinase [Bacteroidales bacterium]|nr:thiamine-phosphate kinase [Bacteroidales bacterium]
MKEKMVSGSKDANAPKRTQIAEIGKRELLRRLFEGTGFSNSPYFYGAPSNQTLSINRLMMEGVDFDLVYTPLKHLGYKSALNAIGPLYAKCCQPKGLSYTLALSARFAAEDIVELWTGVVAAAKEHNIKNLSLELKASMTGLAIGITAQGEQDQQTINSIPKPAGTDLICITGNIGAAYMGLHVLEREKVAFNKIPASEMASYRQPDLSRYKYILSQYLSPEINPKIVDQFKEASLLPAAGYFITDGLAATVKELCQEHGVGAKIYLDKIPIASQTMEMAKEINMDTVTAALNGGDDYKFLFVIPLAEHEKFHKEFPNVDIIGHLCKPEAGALLVTPEGAEIPIQAQGF